MIHKVLVVNDKYIMTSVTRSNSNQLEDMCVGAYPAWSVHTLVDVWHVLLKILIDDKVLSLLSNRNPMLARIIDASYVVLSFIIFTRIGSFSIFNIVMMWGTHMRKHEFYLKTKRRLSQIGKILYLCIRTIVRLQCVYRGPQPLPHGHSLTHQDCFFDLWSTYKFRVFGSRDSVSFPCGCLGLIRPTQVRVGR